MCELCNGPNRLIGDFYKYVSCTPPNREIPFCNVKLKVCGVCTSWFQSPNREIPFCNPNVQAVYMPSFSSFNRLIAKSPFAKYQADIGKLHDCRVSIA